MILISHRGNINGIDVDNENNPLYIDRALGKGYDVEVDVWYVNGKWYLGHDEPTYEIELDYLKDNNLWCHAKNIEALNVMLNNDIHCFWHQEDDVTLTSKGYIWTYPGKKLKSNSIVVMPEKYLEKWWRHNFNSCSGICSDYIINYEE